MLASSSSWEFPLLYALGLLASNFSGSDWISHQQVVGSLWPCAVV